MNRRARRAKQVKQVKQVKQRAIPKEDIRDAMFVKNRFDVKYIPSDENVVFFEQHFLEKSYGIATIPNNWPAFAGHRAIFCVFGSSVVITMLHNDDMKEPILEDSLNPLVSELYKKALPAINQNNKVPVISFLVEFNSDVVRSEICENRSAKYKHNYSNEAIEETMSCIASAWADLVETASGIPQQIHIPNSIIDLMSKPEKNKQDKKTYIARSEKAWRELYIQHVSTFANNPEFFESEFTKYFHSLVNSGQIESLVFLSPGRNYIYKLAGSPYDQKEEKDLDPNLN